MATVGELDAKALVDILADKLSEIKAETLDYALVMWISENYWTRWLTRELNCRLKTLQTHHEIGTLCTDRRARLHASRDKEKDTFWESRKDVKVKALLKTLADRLAKEKAKTVRNTLGHVENYSLVNKFAGTQAEMKVKTIDGKLRNVQAEALVDTTADTLPEVRARILGTY